MRLQPRTRLSALVACAFLTLVFASEAACSQGPSSSDIRGALDRLDARYTVNSVDVEATENEGTKIEPLIKQRFKAKLTGKGIFYVLAPDVAYWNQHYQITLVQAAPGFPANSPPETEVYGIATSTLVADKWSTEVSLSHLDGPPLPRTNDIGPVSHFLGKVYVRGSDDFNHDIAPKDAVFRTHIAQSQAAFLTAGYTASGVVATANTDTASAMGSSDSFPVSITIDTANTTTGEFVGSLVIAKDSPIRLAGHLDALRGDIEFTFSQGTPSPKPCTGAMRATEGNAFEGHFSCAREYVGTNNFVLHLSRTTN
jgi:hypothetical protein